MTLPKTASAQDASIDRPEPISSSAGRLENLLGSPYWPLGSSFLKLLNFPPAFRTNFGLGGTSAPLSISANPKDGHPEVPAETQPAADEPNQMEVDLDGSPIEDDDCSSHGFENEADGHQDDDEDDDHTLEELLVKPRSSENRNQASAGKPSLSDRLTEPSTHKHRSDRDRLSRELDYRQHSRLPFSSIPRNTNFHIKGLANLKRSGQASEPYRTSSNLIECNAKLHPWGNKRPHSTSSDTQSSYPNGKRSRLSEPSDKPSVSKKWVRDRYQDSDEEYDHRRVSKEINSHRYHWPNPHQKSDYHRKQKSVDLSTSHAGDSQDRAASASGSKKVGVQRGVTNLKGKHISQNFHDEVADRERRWMQEFKQYDTAQTAHTRSVSPFPSSHRRSPSRQSPESDEDYYTLTQIAPDLLEALHRAVFSWINRSIAEALLRLGLWLEEKKIWSPHEWGSIRIDQLEKVVDMTYDRGLAFLLWKCSSVEFMDLLQKPIQSGIFFVHQDPQSRAWYIRFGKDFTPIGLAYRPLIKGYRKHLTDSKSQLPIQAGKFVRQYIMSCPNEEDLLYLFKDDKDPMGCLKRAEKEGIIELTDQPPSHVSFGNRGGLHGNKTWFNKTSVENKYITLKPFWLSNTHLVDQPLLSSPTITAQTCDTAPNNDNDLLSNSGGKKNKQDFSNVMETQQGTGHLPAIDRRNSDNTSLSANTSSTTTDAGIEQLDRVPHDHEGEDARSRRSDDIKIIKPTSGRRSHSSDVDTLIQSVIDQLARDTSRRKKY
ncbi:hypothetical protein PTTG_05636 [Puccinia triticina 1-1 BBBD Race 1]|uniref:Uncharacterized protein n=2 Tax=Puccinia triticina TaxID=208348 RepID=A0A180GB36_PUCT1|nr:uncharacterized protein PtA15_4A431 [Puccinia triticina]OAV89895.1 hypothetical protein PTTG_05636 [Puccinia triticina 1-1 BBBD Race 1]WAQ83980.1 hypothetical protein PtA15_4A431 [Puccinia triticina]WAR54830.1 hypothetical protein PtB15_4B448 [Puccinia triticina]